MDYKFITIGVSLSVAFLVCSESPPVKMTNAVCRSYNKSWVAVHYCRLKAFSRNKTSLNINATFIEPANNIHLHMKMMKKASGYKPFLFDYNFDACEFMRKMIKDVSTINHTCPYMGLQTVTDFYLIEFPLPLPSGDYLLLLDWLFDGKPQFATNVYFTLVEDFLNNSSRHGKNN